MNKACMADSMVESYQRGNTVSEVARMFNVSVGKTFYIMRDAGCEFRRKGVGIGFKRTQETKNKISAANKGRRMTDVQKKKLSEAKKCHYNGLNGYGHTKNHCRGYVLAYAPEHPRAHKDGYVMLHTIIMERHIGRYLNDGEVVHHVNHDRNDNRIENLRIMENSEHCRMHMIERNAKGGMTY